MIEPNFNSFAALARRGNLVPVCEVLSSDLLTPLAAWLRLGRNARYACLLESAVGGETAGRYTFLGVNPAEIFRARGLVSILEGGKPPHPEFWREEGHPMEILRGRMARFRAVRFPGLPPFAGGAIGYFAYDMVRLIERIPSHATDDLHLDDAVLMFFSSMIAFDHVQHRLWLIENVRTDGRGALRSKYNAALRRLARTRELLSGPLPRMREARTSGALRLRSNMPRARYLSAVRRAKSHIRAGDAFQIVLSQRWSARSAADPFEIYRALRVVNPSPYLYFLKLGEVAVAGSSPEMLLRVQGRKASYSPIAGTRPRGVTPESDKQLEAELLADPKERAEHIMLVDLGRNDLGRVCEYGSVRVERLMFVERYSHVMHLVSRLCGRLRRGVDCFEALMACFPAGTLTGAPKVRAMEIIESLEPTRRGIYGGAILYLDFSGNLDSCIALRTLVASRGCVYVQAGAGIVADSVPVREFDETVSKARAVIRALEIAHAAPSAPPRSDHKPSAARRKSSAVRGRRR
jgi:anthranilate synthase component 1